jgi:hypothetical protein
MKSRLLLLVILMAFLLVPAGARERKSDFLKRHVGKNVSIIGKYSQFGKVAAFIVLRRAPNEPIYLLDAKDTFPEGSTVKVVGLLRHCAPNKTGPIHDDSWAQPQPYYYFDANKVQLSRVGKETHHI